MERGKFSWKFSHTEKNIVLFVIAMYLKLTSALH